MSRRNISIIRPRRSRSAAAYSHQTFPCTICRSVCLSVGLSVGLSVSLSVCPVHCGKTADRSRQPFGTIGRTGPRMRQVLGFGNRSTGRGTFGGQFGAHHCNQWRLYGVRVRQCLNRQSCGLGWCVRWAEALLYYMGVHIMQGEGEVLLRVFLLRFHNGKCHGIADGEMFRIRMRKLDNISVWQMYHC